MISSNSITLKEKLAEIIKRKISSFPKNPNGFKECENYLKLHKIAVWAYYRGFKKLRGQWNPIINVPETFAIGMNVNTEGLYTNIRGTDKQICVVDVRDTERYNYFLPKELTEKILFLGEMP